VLLGYGVLAGELSARREPDSPGAPRPAGGAADRAARLVAADVVAMPIQPSTLNHRLTTPNKLFEALAVGVPVVASDLPGMASIAVEGGGELCDPTDPASIAAAIQRILDEGPDARAVRRERALAAAHGSHNWEAQVEVLLAEYGRLTGRSW
jgi:glycosyltransferase involved in cell wall biosynthesis